MSIILRSLLFFFYRSHCKCDEAFRKCLKDKDNLKGDSVGQLYFNLLDMKCLAEKDGKTVFEPSPKY